MLQRWRKPVTIALTPDGVTINSGGKPHFIETQSEISGSSSWSQQLVELANNATSISSRKVRFVLSNHYVRYAVLPWQSDVFSHQDWQSLAENHMRTLYGDVIDSWKITVAMQGYGRPLVVSAIDQGLATGLEELATQSNWIIDAVEPALMTVSNHYHNQIKNNAWLMMIEPQRILLAETVKGRVINFSVAFPPAGQETSESIKLFKRALKLLQIDASSNIHLFGESKLLPVMNMENIKSSSLSSNLKSENATMGLMLTKLS